MLQGRAESLPYEVLIAHLFLLGEIYLHASASPSPAQHVTGSALRPSKELITLIQSLMPLKATVVASASAAASASHGASSSGSATLTLRLPAQVRAHAFVALGKLCLRDGALAKRCVTLFAREMDAAARVNWRARVRHAQQQQPQPAATRGFQDDGDGDGQAWLQMMLAGSLHGASGGGGGGGSDPALWLQRHGAADGADDEDEDVDEDDAEGGAAVRNNVLVVLFDLCRTFTSVVDAYVPAMTLCLRDANPLVRKHTVMVLAQLLQEDYLKWKGTARQSGLGGGGGR